MGNYSNKTKLKIIQITQFLTFRKEVKLLSTCILNFHIIKITFVYPHIRLFKAYESASYIYKSYIYDKYEFHLVHIGCQSYKERWKIEKKSLNRLLYIIKITFELLHLARSQSCNVVYTLKWFLKTYCTKSVRIVRITKDFLVHERMYTFALINHII
jgi:hypothetical protein